MSKTRKKRVKNKRKSKVNKKNDTKKNNKRKSNKRRKKKHTKKIMNKKTNTGRGIINVVLTNIDTGEEHRINVDQNRGIINELRERLLTEEHHYSDFNDIEFVMFGDNEINARDLNQSFETHGIEDGARLDVKISEGSHERYCDLYDGGDRCNCAAEESFEYKGHI